MSIFADKQRKTLSRRGFLKAQATGAAALGVISVLGGCKNSAKTDGTAAVIDTKEADYIIDPNSGDSLYDYKENPEEAGHIKAEASFDLPLGCVLYPKNGMWVPATVAGASASPMVKGGGISLSSNSLSEILQAPVAKDINNTVIYDVRMSDSLYVWTELSLKDHSWALYAQTHDAGSLSGDAKTLWQADSNYDPAKFAVSGSTVLWQVMPSLSGTKKSEHSYCYLWHTGDANAQSVVESAGRFATAPEISGSNVILTPRVTNGSGVFYGITCYQLSDDLSSQVDQLILPQSVKPMHATRIGNNFAFSIEANYSTGGLLGQMGSYIGSSNSGNQFIALSREPFAAISGKNNTYIIKSRASYFTVNTQEKIYSILTAVNRAVDYGEYPATSGETDTFITFATVKDADTGKPSSMVCRTFSIL